MGCLGWQKVSVLFSNFKHHALRVVVLRLQYAIIMI